MSWRQLRDMDKALPNVHGTDYAQKLVLYSTPTSTVGRVDY